MDPTQEITRAAPSTPVPTGSQELTTAIHDLGTCHTCGTFVAEDQRYCLACGEPTGEGRENRDRFVGVQPGLAPGQTPRAQTTLTTNPLAPAPAEEPPPPGDHRRYLAYGAGGAAAFLLSALVAGAIGAGLAGGNKTAAQPTILQAAAAAPTGPSTATAATDAFTSDWPPATNGWTVKVKEFDKTASQVADVTAFKTEVAGKGLDAGALDADAYDSLTSGFWIVYAGQYKKEAEAKKALKAVKSNGYADAEVIEVSSGGGEISANDESALGDDKIKDIEKLPPEEQAKARAKLKDETAIPGKPPPKDNKAPGGGSETETIGALLDPRAQSAARSAATKPRRGGDR